MATELKSPAQIQPFPTILLIEGSTFGPFDLNAYISSSGEAGSVRFQAQLSNGHGLPDGLMCTSDGMINGIPATGTHGHYTVIIHAENEAGVLEADLQLKIKARPTIPAEADFNFKSKVWDALGKDLPLPELADLLKRPVSAAEIYYLLQRFATLTIWDVYNLDPPSEKHLLTIKNSSEHFNIYDRGSCLVGGPKELFSTERTLEDALQTARAMAHEVYQRGWVIEFAGFDKMVRAAWIELQLLGDKLGKKIEVLHYTPSEEDLKIYTARGNTPGLKIEL